MRVIVMVHYQNALHYPPHPFLFITDPSLANSQANKQGTDLACMRIKRAATDVSFSR